MRFLDCEILEPYARIQTIASLRHYILLVAATIRHEVLHIILQFGRTVAQSTPSGSRQTGDSRNRCTNQNALNAILVLLAASLIICKELPHCDHAILSTCGTFNLSIPVQIRALSSQSNFCQTISSSYQAPVSVSKCGEMETEVCHFRSGKTTASTRPSVIDPDFELPKMRETEQRDGKRS